MSKEKAELKQLLLNNLGAQVEDMKESTDRDKLSLAGGKQALRQLALQIQGLNAAAEKDFEDGKIESPEQLKIVKLYIDRCRQSALGAAQHLENQEIAAGGASVFGNKLVQHIKKLCDDELVKIKQAEAWAEDTSRRAVGTHPGPSLAQQRKAEADAEKQELQGKKKKAGKKKVTARAKNS